MNMKAGFTFIVILCIAAITHITAPPALAQKCIDGLPCITSKTENDPKVLDDGPNTENAPNASKSSSDSCDADFMNQIYARAASEAEREIVMSKVAIRKPDSVLELTCFDQLAYQAAVDADEIFSNKGTASVENSTISSFTAYITNNFSHKFLGRAPSEEQTNDDFTLGQHKQDNYNCDMMKTINTLSRCLNFGDDSHQFFSLEDLTSNDPRALPSEFQCNKNAITEDQMRLAENIDLEFVNMNEPLTTIDTNCTTPIATGLSYKVNEIDIDNRGRPRLIAAKTYQNKVCVNPLCHYDEEGDSCVKN